MVITNHELRLADDFVQHTGCNIFLTGKAGTGKTTFLHTLQERTEKRMIVTAPTGVAAINARGVTLHSFFQLPFGPFVPGSEAYRHNSQRRFRFSKEKKEIIKSLDLLVIDEISMVRADLLDAVDAVLRYHRRSNMPFGGVQLLMIGDLHQLSPVAKQDEWQLLRQYYESVYFFSSKALAHTALVTIALKQIFRQSDAGFIKLLNKVRNNRLDESARASLNRRYIADFMPDGDQGYITLTTHNHSADTINRKRLQALSGKEHRFKAEISGDFPEHIYPTPAGLLLKEGAQVMFVRNDPSADKCYYNGKIGRITRILGKKISVVCPGDKQKIVVEPVSWENIKYTLNRENGEIREETIGTFDQYPLKLAWAITIHKSQGLTFEKVVIDAQAAFAHGQVYVALSRCKTLDGMVLNTPIPSKGVETDPAVISFEETALKSAPSASLLHSAKISYQQQLLLGCFDFGLMQSHLGYLVHLLLKHTGVVQVSGVADVDRVKRTAAKDIFSVSEKFKRQLATIFKNNNLPESDPHILERIHKASKWFQEKLVFLFEDFLKKIRIDTDNRELRKKIIRTMDNLSKEVTVKLAGVKCCENGFSPSGYLRAVSAAEIDFLPQKEKKVRPPAYTEADIEHPELFQSLKDWRSRRAKAEDVAHFQIMHQRVLIQIVVCLPDNTTDLGKIKGVGKKTIEKYGEELVAIVTDYRSRHGIKKAALPDPVKGPEKTADPVPDTKQLSFDMFNKGKTIIEIAKERNLVLSTIEGHLCFFVKKGELDINRLLSPEKQRAIEKEILSQPDHSLGKLKKDLGDTCSYGEIKMMLAHIKHLNSK